MKRFFTAALTLLAAISLSAQNPSLADIENTLKITKKFQEYTDDLNNLVKAEKRATTAAAIASVEKQLAALDINYNMYLQAHQADVVGNDGLLKSVTAFQATRTALLDNVEKKKSGLDAKKAFEDAEAFISRQDTTYRKLYKMASRYAMSTRTAKLLEKTKAREGVLFAKLQSHYDNAQAAQEIMPEFAERFSAIEDKYFECKSISVKIQEAEYKPFIQRIKDYLLSFAAVAILLMFVNMVIARIKAAKQMKESMKKMKEDIKKKTQQDDIPSI